jgi:hypothetical protein
MSSNINQVFLANPASELLNGDLLYLGRSPYGASNDMAILAENIFPSSVARINNLAAYSDLTGKKLADSLINFTAGYNFLATLTANTAVTFPISGTLATVSQLPSFPINLALGGTGADLTAALGAIPYSTTSEIALLAPTATTNCPLMSGASSAPFWSTASYPNVATTSGSLLRADGMNWVQTTSIFSDTYALNTILYASALNTVSGLAPTGGAALGSDFSGLPTWLPLTDGQILIGSTGVIPVPATLTAGTGISIGNAAGSIVISTSGSPAGWTDVTGATQAMVANNGYIANRSSIITFTLPTTAAFGSYQSVIGKGAGLFTIAQNAGQSINIGSVTSTIGTGGSISSTDQFDSLTLICTVANTTWTILGAPQSSGLSIV